VAAEGSGRLRGGIMSSTCGTCSGLLGVVGLDVGVELRASRRRRGETPSGEAWDLCGHPPRLLGVPAPAEGGRVKEVLLRGEIWSATDPSEAEREGPRGGVARDAVSGWAFQR